MLFSNAWGSRHKNQWLQWFLCKSWNHTGVCQLEPRFSWKLVQITKITVSRLEAISSFWSNPLHYSVKSTWKIFSKSLDLLITKSCLHTACSKDYIATALTCILVLRRQKSDNKYVNENTNSYCHAKFFYCRNVCHWSENNNFGAKKLILTCSKGWPFQLSN